MNVQKYETQATFGYGLWLRRPNWLPLQLFSTACWKNNRPPWIRGDWTEGSNDPVLGNQILHSPWTSVVNGVDAVWQLESSESIWLSNLKNLKESGMFGGKFWFEQTVLLRSFCLCQSLMLNDTSVDLDLLDFPRCRRVQVLEGFPALF